MTYLISARDADYQANLAFVVSQTEYIENQVFEVQYADLRYADLIPVSSEAPAMVETISYMSMDATGQADYLNLGAGDFPTVDIFMKKESKQVIASGLGYTVSWEEAERARTLGVSSIVEKASACRRIAEEFLNRDFLIGSPTITDFNGLIDYPGVTTLASPTTGTGSSALWQNKDGDQIVLDIHSVIYGIVEDTLIVEEADTLLLPTSLYGLIRLKRMGPDNPQTVFQWLQANYPNISIDRLNELETAGAGDTRRIIAYRRAPDVLKAHLPMDYTFLPAAQMIMNTVVPGAQRHGGTEIRKPGAFRQMDGC